MEIIFPEGTPFATERVKTFYTAEDNQKEILVRVLQGNRDDPLGLHKNTELTRQTVRVPKKPRGKVAIDVRMHVDIDGCLTVTVVDDATRNT